MALFAIGIFSTSANARPFQVWSYDKLIKRADVVVVATVISAEKWDEPSDKPVMGDVVFEGRVTTFEVKGVLKGDVVDKEIELVHYKVAANGRIRGGVLTITSEAYVADFEEGTPRERVAAKDGEDVGARHYLLFLKQRKDGKFEPINGQVDSACSVMVLNPEGPANWHREE